MCWISEERQEIRLANLTNAGKRKQKKGGGGELARKTRNHRWHCGQGRQPPLEPGTSLTYI